MISAKDRREGKTPRTTYRNPRLCSLIAGLALTLGAGFHVSAQDGLFNSQEYEKRVKSAQSLAAISADEVFGDRTSGFDGSTEFLVEDVSIPGNFDLPVSIARRFGVEAVNRGSRYSEAKGLTLFDDWEIVVPHMSGVWTKGAGWITGDRGAQTTQRCSVNTAPFLLETWGYTNIGFGIDVKWSGGNGDELLIADDPSYASAPGLEAPKWMTASRARFTCLAATRNGYPGEAFVGHTPDGKKYFFDWGVERPYATAQFSDGAANRSVGRKRVYLLASRVEDRYGNWVSYSYNGDKLTRIESSDNRRIDLSYDADGRVTTVTANGRVWRYAYVGDTDGNDGGLSQVTLPDGSAWAYSHRGRLQSSFPIRKADDEGGCEIRAGSEPPPTQMTVASPSGARGVFDFEMELFIRSDPCNGLLPPFYQAWSLKRRTITGPGLAPMVSTRSYNLQLPGSGRWSSLTKPDGTQIRERYGANPGLNERKLLQKQTLDAAGQVQRDELYTYTFGSETGPFPVRVGRSIGIQAGQFLAGTLSALSESQFSQDGDTYRVVYSDFNRNARPARVAYTGPSGTKAELREHLDTASPWVLDQVLSVKEAASGKTTTQYTYDAMAKPNAVYRAGALLQSVSYASDGTISTVRDGKGNETKIQDWYRGVPRLVINPDGTTNRISADGNGWITSTTDALQRTTSYLHDAMGRVREVQPPVDENQWAKTTISFRPMTVDEYGLSPGHWRVDNAQGARRQETYLDALWQPLLVREYDANDVAGSQRWVRNSYDSQGRQTFASYPSRESGVATGTWTEYDALGRKTSSSQDSEQGLLITTFAYSSNATTTLIDPLGHQTITRFDAFDGPDYEKPAQIIRADGSRVSIKRNAFGLTTEVAQSAN
ncbi:sugar-binding protein [Stenotrophomonas lactitubi]|uniref:RHS repeat domain-containing protein n=1 Tax=Stenotrophomonas lactitubi TaxID=2045214 RepID=UPI000C2750B1|nr:RHS repeat domain-containing protein [Stenotrophomonas lactitubi]PJO53998.1 sugar-binding protein [Stenotrophomonas lactitubi]